MELDPDTTNRRSKRGLSSVDNADAAETECRNLVIEIDGPNPDPDDDGFALTVDDRGAQESIDPGATFRYMKSEAELLRMDIVEHEEDVESKTDLNKHYLVSDNQHLFQLLGGDQKCVMVPPSSDVTKSIFKTPPIVSEFVARVVTGLDLKITEHSNQQEEHFTVVGSLDNLSQGRGVAYSTVAGKKARESSCQETPCRFCIWEKNDTGETNLQYGHHTTLTIQGYPLNPLEQSYPMELTRVDDNNNVVERKGYRLFKGSFDHLVGVVVEDIYSMYNNALDKARESQANDMSIDSGVM